MAAGGREGGVEDKAAALAAKLYIVEFGGIRQADDITDLKSSVPVPAHRLHLQSKDVFLNQASNRHEQLAGTADVMHEGEHAPA